MKEIKDFLKNDRFAAMCGIELLLVKEGYAEAVMPVSEIHMNANGVMQGGALFTLADFTFAAASNSTGPAVGIHADMSFFKPPKGKLVRAVAKKMSQGNRLGGFTAEVRDEDGELIAMFQALSYRKR
ncbi:MAG TPA: hypothetical protein DEQ02_03390 [Ruminococcaceae bacterium]|nr:hypothetical protein [Oscillospiraceae bacterium]